MAEEQNSQNTGTILPRQLEREMETSYMDYAMSVIVGRALPDVRDGLKPVHRRILFAMHELGMTHDKPHKKSARIVGECLGKFHPHGDTAIYDTLVRMAQEFSLRYPLIDGQGNFGCFTKDTNVKLTDGRDLSFEELAREDDEGKKNYTFTIDDKEKIKISKILKPRLTIKNAQIIKVFLDNGEEIRCTLNHKFMLRNGAYKEAQNLLPNDSLMPLYVRFSTKQEDPNLEGYEMVLQPTKDKWEYVHHLADEWNIEQEEYPKSTGRIRHHADFNKLNNNPDNIRRMNWKEHWKTHYAMTSEKHKNDGQYRAKLAEGRKQFWSDLENRKRYSERLSERNKENWADSAYRHEMCKKLSQINKEYIQKHPEKRQEFSERATRTLRALWQNPDYQKQMHLKIIKGNKNHTTNKTGKLKFLAICRQIIAEGNALCEELYERTRNAVYPYGRATTWKKGLQKYFENNPSLVLCELNKNHKVLRTELLKEREDVYDLTIEETHNFALAAGVFVHNSVDGDSAAAMRYTEARMSKISDELLSDIEKETVSFTPNFDASLQEPTVLPSKIPNLLINGSSGIAVGMATNIPPYNLGETVDALVALIDLPQISNEDLLKLIPGPDFPTGAQILGRGGCASSFATGRGSMRMRAVAEIKEQKKTGKKLIEVTELPYQVNKAQLIEHIATLVNEKKLEGISDVNDRSDREGMCIEIEVKKSADANIVLNQLFAHTALESSFGAINLALVDGKPQVLPIPDMLRAFIRHRREVVRKRSLFELVRAEERSHILEGLKTALSNIDAIVKTIKSSKNAQAAKELLMSGYALSEKQSLAILEMKLARLTSLEQEKLLQEHSELQKTIRWLKEVLADEKKIFSIIKKESLEIKEKYADERRTKIVEYEGDLEVEDLIADEKVAVIITQSDYIKRIPLSEYRLQGRGGRGVIGTETKEEDIAKDILIASTHDYLLFFTDKGTVHWLKVYRIPSAGRYAMGRSIVNLLEVENEKIASWLPVREFREEDSIIMATQKGMVKKSDIMEYSRPRKGGIIAIRLKENDRLISVRKTDGKRHILLATRKGYAIKFAEEDVREIGRAGQGVIGIRLEEDDAVIGMALNDRPTLLTLTENGFGKRTSLEEYRLQGRGGYGVYSIKTTDRNGKAIDIRTVSDTDELFLISSRGKVIRTPASDISVIGRNTAGVRIMRLEEGEKVAAVARLIKEAQENGKEEGQTKEGSGKDEGKREDGQPKEDGNQQSEEKKEEPKGEAKKEEETPREKTAPQEEDGGIIVL